METVHSWPSLLKPQKICPSLNILYANDVPFNGRIRCTEAKWNRYFTLKFLRIQLFIFYLELILFLPLFNFRAIMAPLTKQHVCPSHSTISIQQSLSIYFDLTSSILTPVQLSGININSNGSIASARRHIDMGGQFVRPIITSI